MLNLFNIVVFASNRVELQSNILSNANSPSITNVTLTSTCEGRHAVDQVVQVIIA